MSGPCEVADHRRACIGIVYPIVAFLLPIHIPSARAELSLRVFASRSALARSRRSLQRPYCTQRDLFHRRQLRLHSLCTHLCHSKSQIDLAGTGASFWGKLGDST